MARKPKTTRNTKAANIPVEQLQEAIQEINEEQAQNQAPQDGQVQVKIGRAHV